MASLLNGGAALGLSLLCACSAAPAARPVTAAAPVRAHCADATAIMTSNAPLVASHRYAAASQRAERAARIELSCRDRWRAANALIVAAELAHQSGNAERARTLVHEGFAIMRTVRHDTTAAAVSPALLAQQMTSAQRDLRGQWTFW